MQGFSCPYAFMNSMLKKGPSRIHSHISWHTQLVAATSQHNEEHNGAISGATVVGFPGVKPRNISIIWKAAKTARRPP